MLQLSYTRKPVLAQALLKNRCSINQTVVQNKNMKMIKILGLTLAAAGMMTITAQAIPITGGISLEGSYTPNDANLTLATSITFNTAIVSGSPVGTFFTAGVLAGDNVVMASPLGINPAVVPAGPIWSVGGFSLTLTSLTELFNTTDVLVLRGVGTLSHAGYDDTPGTWIGTFQTAGGTYSWSASTGASVPDGGSTLILLGSAICLFGIARKSLRTA